MLALHKKLTDESTASYDTGDELLEKSIYLLRMKILHAVNSIHDYIMTTVSMVIHSLSAYYTPCFY